MRRLGSGRYAAAVVPILVQLLGADGKEADSASDPGLLDKVIDDAEEYRLLGQVDRYRDTVFTKDQMDDFLSDWKIATEWAHHRADQQFALDIKHLAIQVRDGTGLSLRFAGD
jgi:hypothetical protein